jgi:hypothetical protein
MVAQRSRLNPAVTYPLALPSGFSQLTKYSSKVLFLFFLRAVVEHPHFRPRLA